MVGHPENGLNAVASWVTSVCETRHFRPLEWKPVSAAQAAGTRYELSESCVGVTKDLSVR